MGLCFHHYSPGKNSNLNAPVLLRQGAALLSHYGTEREMKMRYKKTHCITLLTFPVLIVYKQLWSSFLWAFCTSETRTDGSTSCLNEGFLTCLRCGSQTQPNKHILYSLYLHCQNIYLFFFCQSERGNTQWYRYDGILSSKYIFSNSLFNNKRKKIQTYAGEQV